ncbi:MAG: D-xylose ABC transporter ATP-binding protein [Acidobacteria bacterium]|nr:MAG: D-xylose ABC transporter ATP-binding protein [Acidobacteriota bacterium]
MAGLLLEAAHITKTFAGVHALRGVSFDLAAGEVHALVGENGAGKSTFIKIVTGAESADSGTLTVAGRAIHRMDPPTARALGVAAIYQNPALFPGLTVAENIALPLDGGRAFGRVDWRARRRNASQILKQVGAAIDPDREVGRLSMPERQLVEIAKAIGANARILIMDEPTASLTEREIGGLLEVVRRLRAAGAGVIYISHKLEEIFAVADRVTVLRDGESIATRPRGQIERGELVRLMIGRELTTMYPKRVVPLGDVALELRGVRQISLTVRRGEIVGVAGLVGSGRTELAETLFGLTPPDEGDILVNGAAAAIASPAHAIRLGIGYVPEDRQRHGVIPAMSIAANTTLSNLAAVSSRGLIDRAAERRASTKYVEQLRIRTPSVLDAVEGLSGGNQQKVALARWLSIQPAVLILDEPTQGIDIAAKAEIHEIMERLAEAGVAILMISSELPELLAMADRIAVMRRGAIAGIVSRSDATPDRVMALALGHAA